MRGGRASQSLCPSAQRRQRGPPLQRPAVGGSATILSSAPRHPKHGAGGSTGTANDILSAVSNVNKQCETTYLRALSNALIKNKNFFFSSRSEFFFRSRDCLLRNRTTGRTRGAPATGRAKSEERNWVFQIEIDYFESCFFLVILFTTLSKIISTQPAFSKNHDNFYATRLL